MCVFNPSTWTLRVQSWLDLISVTCTVQPGLLSGPFSKAKPQSDLRDRYGNAHLTATFWPPSGNLVLFCVFWWVYSDPYTGMGCIIDNCMKYLGTPIHGTLHLSPWQWKATSISLSTRANPYWAVSSLCNSHTVLGITALSFQQQHRIFDWMTVLTKDASVNILKMSPLDGWLCLTIGFSLEI